MKRTPTRITGKPIFIGDVIIVVSVAAAVIVTSVAGFEFFTIKHCNFACGVVDDFFMSTRNA